MNHTVQARVSLLDANIPIKPGGTTVKHTIVMFKLLVGIIVFLNYYFFTPLKRVASKFDAIGFVCQKQPDLKD